MRPDDAVAQGQTETCCECGSAVVHLCLVKCCVKMTAVLKHTPRDFNWITFLVCVCRVVIVHHGK
jgi:hypothetical protein